MSFPPNNNNQFPAWDFTPSAHAPGAGVDHTGPQFPPGFPFGFPFAPGADGPWTERGGRGGWPFGGGPGGWGGGRHGRHGRHGHGRDDGQEPYTDRDESGEEGVAAAAAEDTTMKEKDGSPETLRADGDHPDPPESVPLPHRPAAGPHGHGRGRHGRRGGSCGRGGMRGHHRGPFFAHAHGFGPHGGPGGPGGPAWWRAFAGHPLAQGLREYFGNNNNNGAAAAAAGDDVESFTPPVDTFHSARGWVVHVAVPGAKKEDVGVHWDAEKSLLAVSGVVYRPGDEAFLSGLVGGERKVGLFRREIKLPPPGAEQAVSSKDEVDADGITARMEDGILIVEVPVVEREWTEVRKVDIQ